MHIFYKYRDLTTEFLKEKGNYDFVKLKDEPEKFIKRLKSLFDNRLNRPEGEQFQEEWYSFVVSQTGERRLALDAANIQNFPNGTELIIVNKNGSLYDHYMTSDSSLDSSKYKIEDWMLSGADSINKLNNGQVKVSRGESHIIIDFVADEKGIRRPVIKKKQYSPNPPSYSSPLIIWQRDKETNQASFYCGQIPQDLMQLHPHLFSERHNTLLGQLTVSAYSPEARDQMPKEISMRGTNGREKVQPMLEAQSVLLVPNHAELFLKQSPVIMDLENIAKR